MTPTFTHLTISILAVYTSGALCLCVVAIIRRDEHHYTDIEDENRTER